MTNPALITDLTNVCGPDGVRHRMADLLVFEADGSVEGAVETTLPLAVVLPTTTEQVAGVVKVARKHGLPIVARGAGTGLSGGAVAIEPGIIISLTRMD